MKARWLSAAREQYLRTLLAQDSEAAMARLKVAVNRAIEQLEMSPESAPRHKRSSHYRDDARLLKIGEYRLGYFIDAEREEILVFSLVHSSVNPDVAFD